MVMMIMVKTLRRAVCSGSQACNTSLPLPRQHCTLLTAHTAHCTLEKGTVCSGRSWARATEHGQGKPKLSSQKEEEIEGGGKAECQRISPLASTESCDQNHKKSAVQFSYQSPADINLCIILYTTEPAAAHQTSWSSLLVSCFLQQWCRLPSSFQCRNHHHFQPANFSPTFLSFPSLLFGI